MQNQLQEASALFERLNDHETMDSCWDIFLSEMQSHGFCNVMYGFVSGLDQNKEMPEVTYFSDYSQEWNEQYERLGGQKNDIGVIHCLSSEEDQRWYTPALMARLTPEQKSIELAAQDSGISNGISFPLRAGPHTNARGGIGLASELDDDAFDALLSHRQDYLRLISQIFHAVVLSRPLAKNIRLLTDYEKEALSLAARGLKTKEIAHVLGLSDKAVEQRIDRAVKKLDSSNRTQAVAEAIRLHILTV